MNYVKTRQVKSPVRGTERSAGIDFFIPVIDEDYILDVMSVNNDEVEADQIYIDKTEGVIILAPGAHVLLPSGIKADFTSIDGALMDSKNGIAYIAFNKSGVAKNKRLDVGATVCDEDYQGEIHMSLVNTSNKLIKLSSNEKIIQFIATQILLPEPKESKTDLFETVSERGTGGFGSTNKKD